MAFSYLLPFGKVIYLMTLPSFVEIYLRVTILCRFQCSIFLWIGPKTQYLVLANVSLCITETLEFIDPLHHICVQIEVCAKCALTKIAEIMYLEIIFAVRQFILLDFASCHLYWCRSYLTFTPNCITC